MPSGETSKQFIDPICGMTVEPRSAAGSFEYNGTTYYFCSKGCLQKFQQDPERFLQTPTPQLIQPVRIERAARSSGNTRAQALFTCPMHPEVRQTTPGSCPKCGMALEPLQASLPRSKTEYTCPMHLEVVRDAPGSCPICGMALEPRTVTLEEGPNPELADMTRRFWISAAFSAPLLVGAMAGVLPAWLELALATPVVLWGAWPFFERAWSSVVHRSLNMFTLIGLGVAVAYGYSVVATIAPQLFPPGFRDDMGEVG